MTSNLPASPGTGFLASLASSPALRPVSLALSMASLGTMHTECPEASGCENALTESSMAADSSSAEWPSDELRAVFLWRTNSVPPTSTAPSDSAAAIASWTYRDGSLRFTIFLSTFTGPYLNLPDAMPA